MNNWKVLYIEHDDEARNQVISSMNSLKDEDKFILIPISDPNQIDIQMKDTIFDLVLTDVSWPLPEDPSKEEWSRIEDVIKEVRKRNRTIPIVALSGKPSTFEKVKPFSGEVYDIWSKLGGYIEYLPYRVKNLIKSRQNILSEEALLDYTKEICDHLTVWEKERILEFIENYKMIPGLGMLLSKIISLFKQLAHESGLKASYVEGLFHEFANLEPMDLARSSEAWGHLRHSLSVYLAGYNIINTPTFNWKNIIEALDFKDEDELNISWFLASSFHDSTIFIEHIPYILENIHNISSVRLNNIINSEITMADKKKPQLVNLASINNCKIDYSDEDYHEVNELLTNCGKGKIYPLIESYMRGNKVDHGILSAINLYKINKLKNSKCKENVLLNACYAILVHNCIDVIEDLELTEDTDFLAQLLCLIDHFQAWGRENQYEGLFYNTCIEKIVVRKFDVTYDKNIGSHQWIMNIDYIPFRYISQASPEMQNAIDKLDTIIRKHIDILQRIGLIKEKKSKKWRDIELDFNFLILGQNL